MSQSLKVVTAFGPFTVGQIITDPGQVAAILAAGYGSNVTDGSMPAAVSGTLIVVFGPPNLALGAAWQFALDRTSTPKTLYSWSGTAWAVEIQAGSGGTAPVLQPLALSSLAATVGVAFSATISGQTAGSTVTATSSDGAVLSVANGQVSGTFSSAGQPTLSLTETPTGGGASKTTQVVMTVSAAAATGGALDFSDPSNSALAGG